MGPPHNTEFKWMYKPGLKALQKKKKNLQPRIIYLAILPCRIEGERKKFLSNKTKKNIAILSLL